MVNGRQQLKGLFPFFGSGVCLKSWWVLVAFWGKTVRNSLCVKNRRTNSRAILTSNISAILHQKIIYGHGLFIIYGLAMHILFFWDHAMPKIQQLHDAKEVKFKIKWTTRKCLKFRNLWKICSPFVSLASLQKFLPISPKQEPTESSQIQVRWLTPLFKKEKRLTKKHYWKLLYRFIQKKSSY